MYYAICLVICNMQTKGGNGRRGERLQHSSVCSMLACCTADPSSNPGSALQGGFLLRESNIERGTESILLYKGTVSVLSVLAGTVNTINIKIC